MNKNKITILIFALLVVVAEIYVIWNISKNSQTKLFQIQNLKEKKSIKPNISQDKTALPKDPEDAQLYTQKEVVPKNNCLKQQDNPKKSFYK